MWSIWLAAPLTMASPPPCPSLPGLLVALEDKVEELSPSNLAGTWTSRTCEQWPGPKFLLRRLAVSENSTGWTTNYEEHRYSDPYCSLALFSLTITASLTLLGDSLSVPFKTKAILHTASLLSHSRQIQLPTQCEPEAGWSGSGHWRVGGACLEALGLDLESQMASLTLERRVRLMGGPPHPSPWLWFDQSQSNKAPSPHPLALYRGNHHCRICHRVVNSSIQLPPLLTPLKHMAIRHTTLAGSWHSSSCEPRGGGLYVMRLVTFLPKHRWTARYLYHTDHRCSQKQFHLSVSGLYILAGRSQSVAGGEELDLRLEEAQLAPLSQQMVESLGEGWHLGTSRDLSPLGGWAPLRLSLPSLALEMVRMVRSGSGHNLLLLGLPAQPGERPTSYQPPLMQCSTPKEPIALPLISSSANNVSVVLTLALLSISFVFPS